MYRVKFIKSKKELLLTKEEVLNKFQELDRFLLGMKGLSRITVKRNEELILIEEVET